MYTFDRPTPATDGEFGVYADDGVWDAQYLECATVAAGTEIRDPEHYAEVDEHDMDLIGNVNCCVWAASLLRS